MTTTPICTIDETGIHKPDFATVFDYLTANYREIYGSDVYLGNDSQDGQLLGLFAQALHDVNAQCVAAYNAFSPSTAQGIGLSSVVKINGLQRKIPSKSMVDLMITGQTGAVIVNGVASDVSGNKWVLPEEVVIPAEGEILVSALAADFGALTAPAGAISIIATPTQGWQSVYNNSDAVPGMPIEADALLRVRQSLSTNNPSTNLIRGLIGGLLELAGVTRVRVYENDDWAADDNGIPGHALCVVIEGGDSALIAHEIAARKSIGTSTYGTSVRYLADYYGIPSPIRFYRPIDVPINYQVTVKALSGYTLDTNVLIQNAVSEWTNALGIGNDLFVSRAYVPANLSGALASSRYEITGLKVARDAGVLATSDITIAFNELATCSPGDVQITVT